MPPDGKAEEGDGDDDELDFQSIKFGRYPQANGF